MSLWRRVFAERRTIVLPLMVGLIGNIGLLLLAVLPLRRSVESAHAQTLTARNTLALAKRQAQQTTNANTRRKQVEEDLQKLYGGVLPRDFASASRTTNLWLQDAARDAGLEFRGSRFESKDVRESRLARAYTTFTLVGRYPDLRRFLAAVEGASEFVVIERVELAETGTEAPGSDGRLEIALTVATYFERGPTP
jgi:Tfp pilus assembly protein PilO